MAHPAARAAQDGLAADTGIHGPVLTFDWPDIEIGVDSLRLGYDVPRMDAVVFAGGSAYGEEAITAVTTGLKDDGVRSAAWDNIAHATGAIIYDFGPRRLNEIYPDKRLAQAALHALRPGIFPLGAQGAGRMAMQGGFFGCPTHSGEGQRFASLTVSRLPLSWWSMRPARSPTRRATSSNATECPPTAVRGKLPTL
ncbi:MAG TPA: hypothetical protein VMU81_27945 [Acetobacteraceae bacterium]|nr:hypothetical protein [Acetobacteraceae bacterium]